FLHNYLPYWAANFVDRMLILLIPIFGVLIPAFKIAPWLYTYRLKSRIFHWYEQLTEVEVEMSRERNPLPPERTLARLDAIEAETRARRVPSWLREQASLLRGAIAMGRERLRAPDEPAPDPAANPPAHAKNLPIESADLGTPSGVA